MLAVIEDENDSLHRVLKSNTGFNAGIGDRHQKDDSVGSQGTGC
jgi:hypothetical protein